MGEIVTATLRIAFREEGGAEVVGIVDPEGNPFLPFEYRFHSKAHHSSPLDSPTLKTPPKNSVLPL